MSWLMFQRHSVTVTTLEERPLEVTAWREVMSSSTRRLRIRAPIHCAGRVHECATNGSGGQPFVPCAAMETGSHSRQVASRDS